MNLNNVFSSNIKRYWSCISNPRTCCWTHKILLQSFSFLHYITTYSAYFNSPNNSARNLFLFEEKSREKPGRFSTNFNSIPYWTMLRSQYSIQTGGSKWNWLYQIFIWWGYLKHWYVTIKPEDSECLITFRIWAKTYDYISRKEKKVWLE